jgi:hypothetical protein
VLDNLPMSDQVGIALSDGKGFNWNPNFAAAMREGVAHQREVLGAGPPNKELFQITRWGAACVFQSRDARLGRIRQVAFQIARGLSGVAART